MGFIKKAILVGTLIGVTAYAAYKYHDFLKQEVAPRVNYAAEKMYEMKEAFKPGFVKEQAINVQDSYQTERKSK